MIGIALTDDEIIQGLRDSKALVSHLRGLGAERDAWELVTKNYDFWQAKYDRLIEQRDAESKAAKSFYKSWEKTK